MPAISSRTVAIALLVLAVGLGALALLRATQGLENLDGLACPSVLGDDRLVTVLTGKDPECDATRDAQQRLVYWLSASGAVAFFGAVAVWLTGRRR